MKFLRKRGGQSNDKKMAGVKIKTVRNLQDITNHLLIKIRNEAKSLGARWRGDRGMKVNYLLLNINESTWAELIKLNILSVLKTD